MIIFITGSVNFLKELANIVQRIRMTVEQNYPSIVPIVREILRRKCEIFMIENSPITVSESDIEQLAEVRATLVSLFQKFLF